VAANPDLQLLEQAAGSLAQGDVLGAILGPVSTQLSAIFGNAPRGGTLAEIDPERAPLELPARAALRSTGLGAVLGQAWLTQRLSVQPSFRNDSVSLRRAVERTTASFIFFAPLSLLRQVIAAAQTGQTLGGQATFAAPAAPGPPSMLPPLPMEGNMIDAKFEPGMGRELGITEGEPPQLTPGIQRTIDLSRWLVPEEIIGTGEQFFDGPVVGANLFALVRVPARPGKIIGIYNVNILVTTEVAVNNNRFVLKAGTVLEGDPGDTSGTYIRMHGSLRVDVSVGVTDNPRRQSYAKLGPYVVQGKQDYVVGIDAEQAVTYNCFVGVMGYYFDEGMWPIGK